ncbi:MAG: septum site-determining protein MinD [Clostridia bacterium]|nr:septum site-determining protein MinD [Clostridia bacterium]
MDKIIVVTSGKGGVGKSTVAANIAYGLAFDKRKVLLVDMDSGLRSLDLMFGAENELVFDLTDVLDGICTVKQALFPVKMRPGLFLLPASQNSGSASLSPADIRSLLEKLKESFDYIILDCPAGIERGFRNAVSPAGCAILVITPDNVSLRSGERAYQLLTGEGIQDIRLIINRIGRKPPVSTDECINRLEIPVLGFIPDDPAVPLSISTGLPVIESPSAAGDAFERIVKRLLGESVRYKIPYDSLIHRFKTGFGKESSCKDL